MELLRYYLSAMDRFTLLLSIFMIFMAIGLTLAHHIMKKKEKSLKIWRILCLIPLIVCLIHFPIYWLHGALLETILLYGILYITAILMALWQFLYQRKHGCRIAAGIIHIFAILGFILTISLQASLFIKIHNFSTQSYTEAFRSTIETMQKEYILSEWKEIDYDALEQDIMPMIKQAEKKQDKIAYGIALMTYAYRFYDGHITCEIMNQADRETICDRIAGEDYGFSMTTLEDGQTIAVLTEKDSQASELGIQDGTVITKWDNTPIPEAVQDVECIYPELLAFPVASNEEYLKPIFLAGKGGKENTVSFLAEDGTEKTVTLNSMGSYRKRLECAVKRFYHNNIPDKNFSCKMLNDHCGYLRISKESYSIPSDSAASIKGEYPEITEMLDEKLTKLRDKGMDRLIIDLRGNSGGCDFISPAVASLFARENIFHSGFAKYQDGNYIPLKSNIEITKNGKYADIPVVTLVNAQCCSAGDALAADLSLFPNVTLMGITTTNGVNQTVGGFCFTSDSDFVIQYPFFMSIDENGDPFIDTKADRISRVPLDEQIPLTEKAALTIFGGEGDYELDYAVHYLDSSNQ